MAISAIAANCLYIFFWGAHTGVLVGVAEVTLNFTVLATFILSVTCVAKNCHQATPGTSGILAGIYDCQMHTPRSSSWSGRVSECVKVFMIDGHSRVHLPRVELTFLLFIICSFNFQLLRERATL